MASKRSRWMIRLQDDGVADGADRERQRAREDEALPKLAKELMYRKIRPAAYREDAPPRLAAWLRSELLGPALPLNKEENFAEDVLGSPELVADAKIFLETLLRGTSNSGLVERKKRALRNKCVAMVAHFADQRDVRD